MSPAQTWVSDSGEYTVHLTEGFLGNAERLARQNLPNEVGSPLVGSYSDDGNEAAVTETAPLSCDSQGSRFAFSRGVHGLREFFSRLFKRSRGIVHYVGEWHSHPGGAPTPSRTDDRNMQAIADDHSALCPECILVILGVMPTGTEVGVYVYSRSRGRITLTRT